MEVRSNRTGEIKKKNTLFTLKTVYTQDQIVQVSIDEMVSNRLLTDTQCKGKPVKGFPGARTVTIVHEVTAVGFVLRKGGRILLRKPHPCDSAFTFCPLIVLS